MPARGGAAGANGGKGGLEDRGGDDVWLDWGCFVVVSLGVAGAWRGPRAQSSVTGETPFAGSGAASAGNACFVANMRI
jgi:hypothetical protein